MGVILISFLDENVFLFQDVYVMGILNLTTLLLNRDWPRAGPPQAGLWCAGSWLCVGKFHNRSPGDFERVFIKDEDSETRKGLGCKKQQETAWLVLRFGP